MLKEWKLQMRLPNVSPGLQFDTKIVHLHNAASPQAHVVTNRRNLLDKALASTSTCAELASCMSLSH